MYIHNTHAGAYTHVRTHVYIHTHAYTYARFLISLESTIIRYSLRYTPILYRLFGTLPILSSILQFSSVSHFSILFELSTSIPPHSLPPMWVKRIY